MFNKRFGSFGTGRKARFFQKKCSDFLTQTCFWTKKMPPPRFFATIVNLPNNAWVQNNLEKFGTIAKLSTNQHPTLVYGWLSPPLWHLPCCFVCEMYFLISGPQAVRTKPGNSKPMDELRSRSPASDSLATCRPDRAHRQRKPSVLANAFSGTFGSVLAEAGKGLRLEQGLERTLLVQCRLPDHRTGIF